MFDEKGNNTNCKEDKLRRKVLVGKGAPASQKVNINDERFTILGVTNLCGEAVMSVIIMHSSEEKFDPRWAAGADVVGEDILPFGPECVIDGLIVPCYTTCSPTSSITPNILCTMLGLIDARGVFGLRRAKEACKVFGWNVDAMIKPVTPGYLPPDELCNSRGEKVIPLLVPDGHPSRLTHQFLTYIDLETSKTPWSLTPGVPNATNKWQLGDTSEQNGTFGPALTLAKGAVYLKKSASDLPPKEMKLTKLDIVPTTNVAWSASFARTDKNQNALKRLGWNPFTRKLLNDPEIAKTREPIVDVLGQSASSSSSSIPPAPPISSVEGRYLTLNLQEAGDHLGVLGALPKSAAERARILGENKETKKDLTVSEKLAEAVRMSTGVTFIAGVVDYSDGKVLGELDRRDVLDEAIADQKEGRKRGRTEKRSEKFHTLLKTKPDSNTWDMEELKLGVSRKEKVTLASLKKIKKEDLRSRWAKVKDVESDGEEEEEDEDGKNDEDGDAEAKKKQKKETDDAVAKFNSMTSEQKIRLLRR